MKSIMRLKVISVILFVSLISCSIRSDIGNKEIAINTLINDYCHEYLKVNDESPLAVLIRNRESSVFTILNVPKLAMLAYVKNSFEDDNLNIGVINDVVCIYYLDEIQNEEINHEKIPEELINQAKQKEKIALGNIEVLIAHDMPEWEPNLEINYNLNINKKNITNYLKMTKKTKKMSQD